MEGKSKPNELNVATYKAGSLGYGSYKRYKSLYIGSQMKIEALTLENHELAQRLEIALGKLEVYENINKSQSVIISDFKKTVEEALARLVVHVDQHYLIDGDGCEASAAGGGGGGGGGGSFYMVGK